MSETTPLNVDIEAIQQNYQQITYTANFEGDEDEYEVETNEHKFLLLPKRSKWIYALYSIGAGVFILLCYFFMVKLPDMYVPEVRKLPHLKKVSSLPVYLTPTSNHIEELKQHLDPVSRIILIGDVHGSLKPLKKLLKKLKYNGKKDYIVLMGDFITKGKDSMGVLEFAIENNLGCITGNHEYYVLNKYADFHNVDPPMFFSHNTTYVSNRENENDNMVIRSRFNDPEFLLAKKLKPKHIEYLSQCPMILKLGPVPLYGHKLRASRGVAVHAGLRWDIPLEEQVPSDVLEMRKYIPPYYNTTTSDQKYPGAINWSKIWNEKQESLSRKKQTVVYYGHYASRDLEERKFSKGLDTGCYKGKKLTAMVLYSEKDGKNVIYKDELIQVEC